MVKLQNEPKNPSPEARPRPLDARIRGQLGQGLRSLYADAITQAPTPQMEDLLDRLDKPKV